MVKKSYFYASNKWNATKDMLEHDYKLHVLAANKESSGVTSNLILKLYSLKIARVK